MISPNQSFKINEEINDIELSKEDLFSLYPNPIKEGRLLRVEASLLNKTMVKVNNYYGQLVAEFEFSNSNFYEIKTDRLSSGMYFISFIQNGIVSTEKLIIN
ncbi:T9SS type A sorting domain-containing protein [Flavivirga jejuensis]|uniref:T9SS type A sorting domain-containing protein n=1 Tax=Flavivirga jejuensis TaxID=870487 RepID=A0ABT8WUZ9_9FLAO|nr:T9SS type A sorting domain-containing protein [Flavivirga jejuensis]MDO5976706.1 T9SS type A sorting domain-containing protein [Flavivirga jejuensis]